MQESKFVKLFLNSKSFKIPYVFKYLEDVDHNIYETLKTKRKYYIQSNVQSNTLNSFIDYWVSRKSPEINSLNFTEFHQISEEFDLMKDQILLFQNLITRNYHSILYDQNMYIKSKLQEKKQILQQNKEDYHQIIQILFNINNYIRQKLNNELLDACYQNDTKFISISISNKFEYDGILYSIDEREKIATLIGKTENRDTIFVPKSIKYKNEDYKITNIADKAFVNDTNLKKIEFPNDSELLTIGKSSFKNSALESIIIPSTVCEINENAFDKCVNLKNVKFMKDSKLNSIKENAFRYTMIESIDIPYVKFVEEYAFTCPNLKNAIFRNLKTLHFLSFYESPITNLSIPSDIEKFILSDISSELKLEIIKKEKENIILYDNKFLVKKINKNSDEYEDLIFAMPNIVKEEIPCFIKRISFGAFSNCKKIETVIFPDNSQLEIIDRNAFSFSSIKSIIIPPHVKIIGNHSFLSCDQLTTVEFSKCSELEVIHEYAFSDSSIQSVFSLPSSVILEEACFSNALNLKTITIEHRGEENISLVDNKCLIGKSSRNVKDFDVFYFAQHDIESVKIPDSIKYIVPQSFSKCISLKEVKFTNNSKLEVIGDYAFNITGIETITIPDHVKVIGKCSFNSCHHLTEINFSEDSELRIICDLAFNDSAINSFNVPPHVLKICDSAFFCCQQIRAVNCTSNSDLEVIEKHAFLSSSIETLSIPSSINVQNCFNLTEKLNNITVFPTTKKNTIFINNLLIGKSDPSKNIYDTLLLAPRNIKSVIIPSFIKRIQPSAFSGCRVLKKVIFEDNSQLKIIGEFAFSDSGIECISLPDSVAFIDEGAFSSCKKLKKIIISPNSNLESIGKYAFNRSNIEKIFIPHNVIKICESCFANCSNLRIVDFDADSQIHTIDKSVFYETSIVSFHVLKYLSRIEYHSLAFCINLKLVECDDDSRLASVDNESFFGLHSTIFFIDKKSMKLFEKLSFNQF